MGCVQTFLLADLAGYSALTEAHGDAQAADVAADFVLAVRALLPEHDVEEIKTIGDALLLRTDDATQAVNLGRRLVCEVGARERGLGVRVGLHTGTAVRRGGDWFGSGVNVAARVADAALAGEVILTEATRAAIPHPLQLRSRGTTRFKNMSEPVALWALVLDDHAPSARVVDPVCRMALDPAAAQHHLSLRGSEFWFCSDRCQEVFAANPGAFAPQRSRRADLRVSDTARERAARDLGTAFRRGRLDASELEQRIEHVWAARTQGDLFALTHDLPRRRRRGPLWLSVLWPPLLLRRLRSRRRDRS